MTDNLRRRFEQVCAVHHAAILGYARRRTGNADDAADVIAETFLTAWRRIDHIPAGEAACPWLYGVARWEGLDGGQTAVGPGRAGRGHHPHHTGPAFGCPGSEERQPAGLDPPPGCQTGKPKGVFGPPGPTSFGYLTASKACTGS
jgi:Sigma-70 region 2